MTIIAGLGNPGLKYRKTRHNAGFEVIDILSKKHGIAVKKRLRKSLYGEGVINGERVVLIKPQTFMNNSGESIAQWISYYGLNAEDKLIVISDDVTLEPGGIRIRRKGSAGGHNGLKNIIKLTGTENFKRVRIGVGKLKPGDDMISHVLGRMKRDDRKNLEKAQRDAAEAIELMVTGDVDMAMNKYNKKS